MTNILAKCRIFWNTLHAEIRINSGIAQHRPYISELIGQSNRTVSDYGRRHFPGGVA